uniref:Uncharacterized protein n=1 Tax=Euplotes harpa TaxID=151035 RepID=A0A7S3JBE0_9SPIT|mmetsp:Transcript_31031/g.35440  ORF Transcript_31031/g.35440 Transcript_31031/m.35440 type:complete len:259 (+) Transcript_31031:147-923(+)
MNHFHKPKNLKDTRPSLRSTATNFSKGFGQAEDGKRVNSLVNIKSYSRKGPEHISSEVIPSKPKFKDQRQRQNSLSSKSPSTTDLQLKTAQKFLLNTITSKFTKGFMLLKKKPAKNPSRLVCPSAAKVHLINDLRNNTQSFGKTGKSFKIKQKRLKLDVSIWKDKQSSSPQKSAEDVDLRDSYSILQNKYEELVSKMNQFKEQDLYSSQRRLQERKRAMAYENKKLLWNLKLTSEHSMNHSQGFKSQPLNIITEHRYK